MKHIIKQLFIITLVAILFTACNNQEQKHKTPEFQGYVENTQVNVTTRMPGRITKIYVDEGDLLKKGDTVATLDTRELLANRQALVAKLHNIEKNRKRVYNLYKAGAIPLQKLDAINTGYEMVSAKLNALDTRLQDMTIKAPMDGVVTLKVLEPNQMMPPGMPVVIETDPSGTWARFGIPETYLNQINLGDQFTLTSNDPNLSFKAKVIQIIPMATFATHTPTALRDERDIRTFDVKMLLTENQTKCKPGMSVYLTLKPVENQSKTTK